MSEEDMCSTSSSSESDEEDQETVSPMSSSRTIGKPSDFMSFNRLSQNVAKNSASEHSYSKDLAQTSTSKQNNLKEIKLTSSLQPGKEFETYLNVYPYSKRNEQPKDKLKELRLEEIKSKNKCAQPGFEKEHTVRPYFESRRKRRKEGLKERDKTKGSKWFNMPATEVTEEIKNDLTILQMRGSLDPKHFYKRGNDKICPKYFQVGTIIESPAEFYSARIPKKQRKQTLVDELLSDADYRKYQKKKYAEAMKNLPQKRLHASQKKKKINMKQKLNNLEAKKKHKTKKTKK